MKSQITPPQEIINKVFAREFGFNLKKFEELKKEKFFEVDFAKISKNKDLRSSVQYSKSTIEEYILKLDVPYLKLKKVSKDIFAGGDKPKVFSEEETDICKYPIYSNGKEKNGLFGFTNKFRVDEPCVTISARGTIGFSVARNEKFLPIVRLITIITDNEKASNQYLEHALNFIDIQKSGDAIGQLTAPAVEDIEVPIPDLDIQQKIVDEIRKELDNQEEISKKIQTERNEIDDMIEKAIKSDNKHLAYYRHQY